MIDAAPRNLWDYENREVYESSHSVVLALLAAHAQRVGDGAGTAPIPEVGPIDSKGKEQATAVAWPLAEKIVPFYTNCLLEVKYPVCCYCHLRTHVSLSLFLCYLSFHFRILLKAG